MLPDVTHQDREAALHRRAVVLDRRVQAQRAVLSCAREPNPAAAEHPGTGLDEARLQLRETAEIARDRLGECAGGRAPGGRRHGAPEQAVVEMAAGVVAYFRADG